jgi:hypothetical protein
LVHDGTRFVHKKIAFVPGLFKIFDEILGETAVAGASDADQLPSSRPSLFPFPRPFPT